MKKLRYYTLLLLAATLAGCSNELGAPQMNPDYLEPGTSAMQIAVGFPQPKGYAVGDDVAAGVATTEEKEIKSLAFFVKTSHAFAKFLSEEPLLSNNGFTNPLVEESAGNYTASIKVRSTKFEGDSEVIAVANYKENGLDFSKVTTIKQLKELVTATLDGSANLKTPLLMYGQDGAVTLTNQGTAAVTLNMTRIVARLDVKNEAINPADATDDFKLTSVRLLNAPSKSALLPDLRQNFTGIDLPKRTPVGGEAFLDYTYLYEALNDAPANRPMIEVEGTYRGSQVKRQIPFKTQDVPGTPGEYFAVQRNYHYVLTIHPADATNDLTFELAVKDWDAGKQISVKPSIKAPKLENFVWTGVTEAELSNQGITWDATNLKLTLTQKLTDDITLSFDASAYQAPKCVVAKADPATDAELITVDGNIEMGDISGYAEGDPGTPEEPEIIDPDADAPMPLKRTIVFTLPKDVESLVTEGSIHTNLLNVQVTEKYATTITVVYEDKRTPAPPPEP